MPPIPEACESLAAEVAALEAADAALRAELTSLSGAPAWRALTRLGEGRADLRRKRAALEACIQQHSAALQANLVIIDSTASSEGTVSRAGHLWEVTPTSSILRETNQVQGNTFAFVGPLPASFGISVTTNGTPDVLGPDFRSATLTQSDVSPGAATRVEVVLGPEMRIDAAEVSRLASEFKPVSQVVTIAGAGVSAEIAIAAANAALESNAIVGRLSGEVTIRSAIGGTQRGPFSASAKLRLIPSAAAGVSDVFDLVSVSDMAVEAPGQLGQFFAAILPMIRAALTEQLTRHMRDVIREEITKIVTRALVLPDLPAGVTLSIRRLTIGPDAVVFQAAFGALGTSLSTFTPSEIPPP